jgi:hypothetical protein
MVSYFLHDVLKYWVIFFFLLFFFSELFGIVITSVVLSLEPFLLEALASFMFEHTLLTVRKAEVLQDVSFLSLIMQVLHFC